MFAFFEILIFFAVLVLIPLLFYFALNPLFKKLVDLFFAADKDGVFTKSIGALVFVAILYLTHNSWILPLFLVGFAIEWIMVRGFPFDKKSFNTLLVFLFMSGLFFVAIPEADWFWIIIAGLSLIFVFFGEEALPAVNENKMLLIALVWLYIVWILFAEHLPQVNPVYVGGAMVIVGALMMALIFKKRKGWKYQFFLYSWFMASSLIVGLLLFSFHEAFTLPLSHFQSDASLWHALGYGMIFAYLINYLWYILSLTPLTPLFWSVNAWRRRIKNVKNTMKSLSGKYDTSSDITPTIGVWTSVIVVGFFIINILFNIVSHATVVLILILFAPKLLDLLEQKISVLWGNSD